LKIARIQLGADFIGRPASQCSIVLKRDKTDNIRYRGWLSLRNFTWSVTGVYRKMLWFLYSVYRFSSMSKVSPELLNFHRNFLCERQKPTFFQLIPRRESVMNILPGRRICVHFAQNINALIFGGTDQHNFVGFAKWSVCKVDSKMFVTFIFFNFFCITHIEPAKTVVRWPSHLQRCERYKHNYQPKIG
jgi:hypothetical protein